MPASATTIASLLSPLPAILDPWYTSAGVPLQITYQYAGSAQPGDLAFATFSGWTAPSPATMAAIDSALAEFEMAAHIDLAPVTGQADPDLNIGLVSFGAGIGGQGGFQYNYFTNGLGQVTSRTLDSFAVFNSSLDLTTQANRQLLLHELGHALLLKHPGAYDVGGNIPPGPYLPVAEDNQRFTVMSYTAADNGLISNHLMLYDIAALQARFGANLSWHTGADVYTGSATENFCIWDAGGIDTINGSGFASAETIDLNDGAFSSVGATNNLSIAYNAVIENATGGTGNDTIILSAANVNNLVIAGAGSDTVWVTYTFGAGYVAAGSAASFTLTGAAGTDTLQQVEFVHFASGQTVAVSSLVGGSLFTAGDDVVTLTSPGQTWHALDGNDQVTGTSGADVIFGDGGNDVLFGGRGADTLDGGDGSDVFYVDDAADVVIEGAGAGTGYDTIYSTVSYTISANAEQLLIYGGVAGLTATGSAGGELLDATLHIGGVNMNGLGGNDILNGSNYAETLNGGDGGDIIQGFYAVDGVNTMIGGIGDDVYYSISAGDVITEFLGGGYDTVYAQVNTTLSANVDQIVLYGAATSGTGNGDANNIYGNNAAFALTLSGAGGNDVIYGSNFGDTINGGDGADFLVGLAGANTMTGGLGNDQFYSTSATDIISENIGEGFDTLYANYNVATLAANVEQLLTYGGATIANGNGLANTIYANNASNGLSIDTGAGSDVVYGSAFADIIIGGLGNDTLAGGGAADQFRYGTAGNMGADVITDFADGVDHISLAGMGYAVGDIGTAITIGGGANALITFTSGTLAGTTITLNGVAAASTTAGDFFF
jgi:serralysin